jgi:hypothetical protein
MLRQLYSNGFKLADSVKAIKSYTEWRLSTVPDGYRSLIEKVEHLLNCGGVYLHGRDKYFRPIIIINITALLATKCAMPQFIDLICFYLTFMLNEMIIPGKVENWVIITDL